MPIFFLATGLKIQYKVYQTPRHQGIITLWGNILQLLSRTSLWKLFYPLDDCEVYSRRSLKGIYTCTYLIGQCSASGLHCSKSCNTAVTSLKWMKEMSVWSHALFRSDDITTSNKKLCKKNEYCKKTFVKHLAKAGCAQTGSEILYSYAVIHTNPKLCTFFFILQLL